MLSETLQEGLESYEIGPSIRALRMNKGLGLEQLGNHTGLSAGMLSKIERGQVFPTLPTLLRIAMVFGVGLDHFFGAERDKPQLAVLRRKDRIRLPNVTDQMPQYFFESLDYPLPNRPLKAYRAEFANSSPTEPHSHPGVELVYVISGSVEITVSRKKHALGEGDALYFDCLPEHSYRRLGAEPCMILVITCEAPFAAE